MTFADFNQILLLLVITSLSVVLVIAGIQVIQILKELRLTVKKTNRILDDAEVVSSSIAKPVSHLSGFVAGLKSGSDIISLFLNHKKTK